MTCAALAFAIWATAQDPPKARTAAAYDKAISHVLSQFPKASFSVKFVCGFLFLADGRYPAQLQQVIEACGRAHKSANSFNGNWGVAMAALFLSEVYRLRPSEEVKAALLKLVETAAGSQEPTGGWTHHKGFGAGKKYCSDDLAIVTAMLYSAFRNMAASKFEPPRGLVEKTERNLLGLLTPQGLNYGTRDAWGETTGSRIGFASLGLLSAGMTDHKICSTAASALPARLPKLDRGHGTGALHLLGVVLACHRLGPDMYRRLTDAWLEKLIALQDAQGGLLLGDDKAAGGEARLMGGNAGSTAAFALMMLLHKDPDRLKPARRTGPGGRSPFSQR
jgi:hypothetical protein